MDEKYLLQLSTQLPLFKNKGGNVYNHRCPFCGDSQKNPTKCRGFHYELKGSLVYKCHNCGKSCLTAMFIKELAPDLYKEYRMEIFKETRGSKSRPTPQPVITTPQKPLEESLFDGLMDNVKNLPSDHKAVQLLNRRMIPKDFWKDLYYLDDMRKIGQLNPKMREKLTVAEDRLVIPYRDRKGNVIGITCRSFEQDATLRYVAIPINADYPQVFGYDRANLKKDVYVVEGAFDSMFIPNCISVGGSNLKVVERILDKSKAKLIYDAEPRNRQIVKLISQAIKLNYTVVLLPETGYKDINAMIQGGWKPDKIMELIKENTVQGLQAKLKFQGWKKID